MGHLFCCCCFPAVQCLSVFGVGNSSSNSSIISSYLDSPGIHFISVSKRRQLIDWRQRWQTQLEHTFTQKKLNEWKRDAWHIGGHQWTARERKRELAGLVVHGRTAVIDRKWLSETVSNDGGGDEGDGGNGCGSGGGGSTDAFTSF